MGENRQWLGMGVLKPTNTPQPVRSGGRGDLEGLGELSDWGKLVKPTSPFSTHLLFKFTIHSFIHSILSHPSTHQPNDFLSIRPQLFQ